MGMTMAERRILQLTCTISSRSRGLRTSTSLFGLWTIMCPATVSRRRHRTKRCVILQRNTVSGFMRARVSAIR